MCMRTDCKECGKPTWKGCGKHIEEALKGVPDDERCKCSRESCAATAAITKKIEEVKVESTTKEETKTDKTKIEDESAVSETKADEEVQSHETTVEIKIDDKSEVNKKTTADKQNIKSEEAKVKED